MKTSDPGCRIAAWSPTPVSLSRTGKTWVFATALDWPGWCRRGKGGEEAALEALDEYAKRYRKIVGTAFKPGPFEVVGSVKSDMHADFGAPGIAGPWDSEPLTSKELQRLTGLLEKCWNAFDKTVAKAPAELAKGPRGGGRDRDGIANHVREAERAYTSRAGSRVPPRTPWPEQRAIILDGLRVGNHRQMADEVRDQPHRLARHRPPVGDRGQEQLISPCTPRDSNPQRRDLESALCR